MFDEKTLTEFQEAEKLWRAALDQMQERMKSDGRKKRARVKESKR